MGEPMPTTQDDIRRWLGEATERRATHMVVVTDTFDWEDYPVFVLQGEETGERLAEVGGQPMQKVIEVYSMSLPLEPQVAERRAYHPD